MSKKLNIINKKYNHLLVLEEVQPHIQPSGTKMRKYKCQCDCGKIIEVAQPSITRGLTKSCGCHRIKHNMTDTKEYQVWRDMKQRCLNTNHPSYKNYGGRGIKICQQWIDSFETFLKDVGTAPYKKSTLDRINNQADYTPDNIRWTDYTVQNINKRLQKRNKTGCPGVYKHGQCNNKWTAYININKKHTYLGIFDTKEEAVQARKDAEQMHYKPKL